MANIYNLFKFIENTRPEYKVPLAVKLIHTPETLTKEELQVGGGLYLRDTPIATKYSASQIKDMVPGVNGSIYL